MPKTGSPRALQPSLRAVSVPLALSAVQTCQFSCPSPCPTPLIYDRDTPEGPEGICAGVQVGDRKAESMNGWYHPPGRQALSLDFILKRKIIPCVSLSPRRCYNPWKSYYKDFQGPLSRRESLECAARSGPLRYYPEEMASPAHSPASYHFRHPITSASVRILLPAVTEIPTQAVLNDILKESAGPGWSHSR